MHGFSGLLHPLTRITSFEQGYRNSCEQNLALDVGLVTFAYIEALHTCKKQAATPRGNLPNDFTREFAEQTPRQFATQIAPRHILD